MLGADTLPAPHGCGATVFRGITCDSTATWRSRCCGASGPLFVGRPILSNEILRRLIARQRGRDMRLTLPRATKSSFRTTDEAKLRRRQDAKRLAGFATPTLAQAPGSRSLHPKADARRPRALCESVAGFIPVASAALVHPPASRRSVTHLDAANARFAR
jgi:hypothetical protein